MWRWLTLFGVLVWASLACVTKPEACADSCAGCCTSTGSCVGGTETTACGRAGEACTDCRLQHSVCLAQVCVLAPDGGGAGGGGTNDAGSTDAGAGDAGLPVDAGTYADGGSPNRYWDGGTCTLATDCPCFSSDDCGPGFYCHSEDSTGLKVFCVPGARGTGLAGDPCAGEADCLSALCTDSSSTGKRCSALCDLPAECPPTLPRCVYIGFGVDRSICAP